MSIVLIATLTLAHKARCDLPAVASRKQKPYRSRCRSRKTRLFKIQEHHHYSRALPEIWMSRMIFESLNDGTTDF